MSIIHCSWEADGRRTGLVSSRGEGTSSSDRVAACVLDRASFSCTIAEGERIPLQLSNVRRAAQQLANMEVRPILPLPSMIDLGGMRHSAPGGALKHAKLDWARRVFRLM